MGLKFGRTENILYVYALFDDKPTLTMMDSSATIAWTYSFNEEDVNKNYLIEYKAIDINTDLIVATSGYTNIKYNLILASSASPYSI